MQDISDFEAYCLRVQVEKKKREEKEKKKAHRMKQQNRDKLSDWSRANPNPMEQFDQATLDSMDNECFQTYVALYKKWRAEYNAQFLALCGGGTELYYHYRQNTPEEAKARHEYEIQQFINGINADEEDLDNLQVGLTYAKELTPAEKDRIRSGRINSVDQ
jgi:hypothetical protein